MQAETYVAVGIAHFDVAGANLSNTGGSDRLALANVSGHLKVLRKSGCSFRNDEDATDTTELKPLR